MWSIPFVRQFVVIALLLPFSMAIVPLEDNSAQTLHGNQQTVKLLYPELSGAFIELWVEPLRPDLWTRIQWQDAFGDWHDVEGWQGSLNSDERGLWYVGPEHLGVGPFRWLVYERPDGQLLAASLPFNLPAQNGEVLQVTMDLPAAGAPPATVQTVVALPRPARYVVYKTTFDRLASGRTQPFPGAAGQDGWYQELALEPGYGEITNEMAVSGQALHQFTSSAVPGLTQTIDKRLIAPPDLNRYPFITLQVSFYARTNNLSARNSYDAFIAVNGGPHPGYEIIGFSVNSGNGTPRSRAGVNIVLNSYNGQDNNIPISPAVGQQLTWETWHEVTLVVNHAQGRYVSLTVNGQTESLSAYCLPRSELDGVWQRGRLMEEIVANIAPHVGFGDASEDDIYWDNLRLLVSPAGQQ